MGQINDGFAGCPIVQTVYPKEASVKRVLIVLSLVLAASGASAAPMTDAQVEHAIIHEYISSFSTPCACPYQVLRNKTICGAGSGVSHHPGTKPICYRRDVTAQMVRDWRATHER